MVFGECAECGECRGFGFNQAAIMILTAKRCLHGGEYVK